VEKHNIKCVVHLGDLVDRRKFLNYATATAMRNEYIEPSTRLRLETHIIAGNHDCYHKNNNEVNALREIVMGREGFKIYSNPTIVNFMADPSLKTLMLPWISPENEEKSADMIRGNNIDICFAHLELAGFEMARGQMMEHGMDAAAFSQFDAVYTGHYHHKSSKGNIHYLGTPYELTWADCDDQKGFHVLDTITREIEFIPNPITLFKKIHFNSKDEKWNVDDKIVKVIIHPDANRKALESFISQAEQTSIDIQVVDQHLDIDESGGQVITIKDVEDTMKIVSDYITASDMDVDKSALIGMMKQLYVEAQQ
jgi:DNA repair exonuclease SbcCD nuclease subunit